MSDLDDEELEATRRLNGVAKESNIEEDIKYIKDCLWIVRVVFDEIKKETDYKELDDVAFCIAVDHILAEREEDKKRIKELEEENRKKSIETICYQEELEDSIPVQKVKEKIEEYNKKIEKYNEYRKQGKETDVEYYENITNTEIKIILENLLEDK